MGHPTIMTHINSFPSLCFGPWYLISIYQPIIHFLIGFILVWSSFGVFTWVFSSQFWANFVLFFLLSILPTYRSLVAFYNLGLFGENSSCGALSVLHFPDNLLALGVVVIIGVAIFIAIFGDFEKSGFTFPLLFKDLDHHA